MVEILAAVYVPIDEIIIHHGQQKWSSCSGFGWTRFSQGKNEIQFLQKGTNKKSAIVIFGLARLIILS